MSASMLMPIIFFIITFEREWAEDQWVKQDAERPDVNFMIILFLGKNLWGHVVSSSADSISFFLNLSGEAEVTNFCDHFIGVFIFSQKDILWFYVPMHNFPLVHVLETIDNFTNDLFGFGQRQHFIGSFRENWAEVSHVTVLHQHEDPAFS